MAIKSITSYMSEVFQSPKTIFDAAFELLGDKEFDTMVGTGLSGSLIVPVLAREFGSDFNFAIVRKDPSSSHSSSDLEGTIGDRWVFVDDLIDSGATLHRVRRAVDSTVKRYSSGDSSTEYVGTYLYHTRRWYNPDHKVGYYEACPCETCKKVYGIYR